MCWLLRVSDFTESFKFLKKNGVQCFLLPTSLLKIKVHADFRRFVTHETRMESLMCYRERFKGVFTDFISLKVSKKPIFESQNYTVTSENNEVSRKEFVPCEDDFCSIPVLNDRVEAIISKVERLRHDDLSHSRWALGIITGNNAKMCKRSRHGGLVALYRGKDILPGKLKAASLYIDPKDFPRYQQVSSMALLKAPEKLIYRFISSDLVFYCDTHQRYILNSANMLVLDERFPLSAKELAEIMNSQLTNWLFKQLFNTHRILRGDLELLPIFTDLSLHRRFNLLDLGW